MPDSPMRGPSPGSPVGEEETAGDLPVTPVADDGWGGEVPPMACWYWGQGWDPAQGQCPAGPDWSEWSNWGEIPWSNQEGEDWENANMYPGMAGAYCGGQQGTGEWTEYCGGWGDQGWQEGVDNDGEYRPDRPKPAGWRSRAGRSHIYVPRRLNLVERFHHRRVGEDITTLMIRNVPNQYHRGMLMQELDTLGFRGKYDFVYLPIDNATFWNVGYAFVNFEDSADALRCMEVMEGHEFLRFRPGRKRVAQVSVAHIQGLEQNLAHCTGTSVFSTNAPWLRPWIRRRSKQWQQEDEEDPQQSHEQPPLGHVNGLQVPQGYGLNNACQMDWEWQGHGTPSQATRVPSYPSIPSSPPSLTAHDQASLDGPVGEWLPPTQDEIARGRGRPGQVHPRRDQAMQWASAVSRTPSVSPEPRAAAPGADRKSVV